VGGLILNGNFMAMKWGIKNRVLFLALTPTITISILLGVYFIGIRLEDLSKALNDRGTAVAARLASQGEYGLFARDTDALRSLARRAINKEISSVGFYNKKGNEIASAGKLNSDITPPTTNIAPVQIIANHLNDTISFIAPITLPDVIIDSYPNTAPTMADESLKTTVIGWVKVELDHKATRLKEYQVLIHSALIVLLGLSISSLLALRLGYDVTQPILELTNAVEKIKNGHLETRVKSQSHWELGILESGINTMAGSLQIAHEELQHNIDKATADVRQTIKTIEIQNIELELARKEAEAATQVKSEFLASMSHELRTPLNGIVGFINLLDKTELTERQHDFLKIIQKSSHSLLSIINDILDFSKIEAGKMQLDVLPMDIRETVEDALTLLGPSAHEKALEIVPFVYSDVPNKIACDALRIKQIITNLVSNSIKFTQHGSVIVRVMLEQNSHTQVTICVSVTDTGIGLSEEQQKHLFHAFNQTDPDITRRYGGTGLGLVICKKLVEQMNGTIDMESEPGKGTTFWFTVRADKVADLVPAEESKVRNIRILLYERHRITRLAIIHLLEQWGMRVEECEHPDDIPMLVKQAIQENDPFKMTIIGINQPLVEKEFIINTINSIKEPYGCPVGILANTTEYLVHSEILQFGATLCLAKPVCRRKFYEALSRIFITQPQLSMEEISAPLPSLKVLAVDDNQANLKLVKVFLENIGVIATLAKSGYEALQFSKKNNYNLILMDLHMPGIDGIETTEQIRNSNNPNYNTPIVALSAHVLISDQEKIHAAGMNDYLTKPIDENSLRASIYKWTHSGVRSQDKESIVVEKIIKERSIDWELSKKLAGQKRDLADEMLTMLILSLPDDKTQILKAYMANDLLDMRELVHKLHGACCYVGVPKLKDIAKTLETACVNDDTDQIKLLVGQLAEEIEAILSYYRSDAFQGVLEVEVGVSA
jgi:two-component system sensor histidine kinase BarA